MLPTTAPNFSHSSLPAEADVRQAAMIAAESAHIRELDGIRAIAMWLVLFDHMIDGWRLPPESLSWIPGAIYFVMSHGWMGVDLFFVLSGFLITGILLDERARQAYLRSFYARRFLRIVPLTVACIAIEAFCYGSHYRRFFLLALLFSANLDNMFGVPQPHGPGVFWSLAVEEHFYLIWPVAVRFLKRRTVTILAAAVFVLSPWARAAGFALGLRPGVELYQYSWFHFDGLAAGALLAIFVRSSRWSPRIARRVIISLLAAAVFVSGAGWPFGIMTAGTIVGSALRYTQGYLVFAAVIVSALSLRNSTWTAPLRTEFAAVSARYSYCIYLVHLSLGDLYYWLLREFDIAEIVQFGAPGALIVRSIVIISSSFLVAAVSHRYLEMPFMRLRRYVA